MNENIDIKSKESLNEETNSSTTFSVHDKISYNNKTEPTSIPYTKHMLISNISVDGYAQSFEIPRKKNHSVTAPSDYGFWGYDSMQFQHKIISNRPVQKTPLTGK